MSERIKYVSREKIELKRNERDIVTLIPTHGLVFRYDPIEDGRERYYEPEALAALAEVITANQRDGDFRAFKPEPKVRPYTPSEMAKQVFTIGSRYVLEKCSGDQYKIESVSEVGVALAGLAVIPFERLHTHWKWADESPMGVIE